MTTKERFLNCACFGYWTKDCCKPKKVSAHLTHAEEDNVEPTLLIAHVCALSETMHLDELRAQAFMDTTNGDVEHLDGWYLDTRATKHMTGRAVVISDIDRALVGSVKFGSGLMVSIQSRGSILFTGKIGARKVPTTIFYVLRL